MMLDESAYELQVLGSGRRFVDSYLARKLVGERRVVGLQLLDTVGLGLRQKNR